MVMSLIWHREMSYHAPHTMTEAEVDELEQSEAPGGAAETAPVETKQEVGQNQGVLPGLRQEVGHNQGVLPGLRQEVWVVYDYDHQTTRYSYPLTAYTTKAAALAHRAESGWVGVHRLDVWHSVEDWKAAGKPTYEN